MEKIQIGLNFFIPMPVVKAGSLVKGKANFIPVGLVCPGEWKPFDEALKSL
ncbi:MAG: hypothetical protein WCH85_02915 [Methanomicrobiales archaeon]